MSDDIIAQFFCFGKHKVKEKSQNRQLRLYKIQEMCYNFV